MTIDSYRIDLDSLIQERLKELGFRFSGKRVAEYPSSVNITWRLAIELKPMIKREFLVSVEHVHATKFAKGVYGEFLKNKSYAEYWRKNKSRMRFLEKSVSSFLSDNHTMMDVYEVEDQVHRQLDMLSRCVVPYAMSINGDDAYESMLKTDAIPFRWWHTSSLGRAAELFYLVAERGADGVSSVCEIRDNMVFRPSEVGTLGFSEFLGALEEFYLRWKNSRRSTGFSNRG